MRFFLVVPFLGLALLSGPALADQAAATACSAKLSTDARLIYGKVAPAVTPETDIKAAVVDVTRPLVMNGSLSRAVARPAAEAAGECLRLLK